MDCASELVGATLGTDLDHPLRSFPPLRHKSMARGCAPVAVLEGAGIHRWGLLPDGSWQQIRTSRAFAGRRNTRAQRGKRAVAARATLRSLEARSLERGPFPTTTNIHSEGSGLLPPPPTNTLRAVRNSIS